MCVFFTTHVSAERSVVDAARLLPQNQRKAKFVTLAAHVGTATPPNAGLSHSLQRKRPRTSYGIARRT